MAEPFVGEIKAFPYNFAPNGWAMCQGQLLPISQNTALFSLLGTFYGGDGRTNFALPNLQGNIAIGFQQGPGLSNYNVGDTGGAQNVTLNSGQLPSHTHTLPVSAATTTKQATPGPSNFLGATGGGRTGGINAYAPQTLQTANPVSMLATAVGGGGSGQPHNNMAPYLVLTFCIALQGIFPERS